MAEDLTEKRKAQLPDESEYDWENYKKKFEKSYKPDEDEMRKKLFLDNVAEVKKRNQLYVEGKCTFISGVNHLSDRTAEEKSRLCGATFKRN